MLFTCSLTLIFSSFFFFFFFNDTATTEIYTLSLHDALPILVVDRLRTHITHREKEVCWKFPLHHQVPGLDVASLQFARANAPLQCLGRKRNGPAADVGTTDARNADWERSARKRRS